MKKKPSRTPNVKTIRTQDRVLFKGLEFRTSSRIGTGFYLVPTEMAKAAGYEKGLWVDRSEIQKLWEDPQQLNLLA